MHVLLEKPYEICSNNMDSVNGILRSTYINGTLLDRSPLYEKKINMVLQCREHALGPPHTHMQNTAKIML